MDNTQTNLDVINALKSKISDICEKQAGDLREYGKVSELSKTQIHDLDRKLQETVQKLEKCSEVVEAMEAKSQRSPSNSTGQSHEKKSVFNTLVNSDEFKYMQKNKRSSMNTVNLGGLGNYPEFNTKSISGLTDMRDIFSTLRLPNIVSDPLRPTRIRDLFVNVTTKNAVVEWLRQKPAPAGFTNASAPVAEGAIKPESAFDFELVSSPMSTLATWIPITKQALSELPMLEDHINRYLLGGLKEVEDVQLLYGSGSGANLTGIYNQSGIQQYVQLAGETRIDAFRRGITKLQNAYFEPDRIIMHPNDWEKVELTKDTQDRYLYANIATGAERVLWRLPVVASTAVNENNPMVGSFASRAATLYDFDQAEMAITDSHGDNFIYNTYVIRLEEKLTLTAPQPRGFCEIVNGAAYN